MDGAILLLGLAAIVLLGMLFRPMQPPGVIVRPRCPGCNREVDRLNRYTKRCKRCDGAP